MYYELMDLIDKGYKVEIECIEKFPFTVGLTIRKDGRIRTAFVTSSAHISLHDIIAGMLEEMDKTFDFMSVEEKTDETRE